MLIIGNGRMITRDFLYPEVIFVFYSLIFHLPFLSVYGKFSLDHTNC